RSAGRRGPGCARPPTLCRGPLGRRDPRPAREPGVRSARTHAHEGARAEVSPRSTAARRTRTLSCMGVLSPPVSLAIFFITFVVTRIVHERALRKLDTHTKGRLVEAFASLRVISLLPMAGLAAGYVAISMVDGLSMSTVLAIYFP